MGNLMLWNHFHIDKLWQIILYCKVGSVVCLSPPYLNNFGRRTNEGMWSLTQTCRSIMLQPTKPGVNRRYCTVKADQTSGRNHATVPARGASTERDQPRRWARGVQGKSDGRGRDQSVTDTGGTWRPM